jgi:hypothetical protein
VRAKDEVVKQRETEISGLRQETERLKKALSALERGAAEQAGRTSADAEVLKTKDRQLQTQQEQLTQVKPKKKGTANETENQKQGETQSIFSPFLLFSILLSFFFFSFSFFFRLRNWPGRGPKRWTSCKRSTMRSKRRCENAISMMPSGRGFSSRNSSATSW